MLFIYACSLFMHLFINKSRCKKKDTLPCKIAFQQTQYSILVVVVFLRLADAQSAVRQVAVVVVVPTFPLESIKKKNLFHADFHFGTALSARTLVGARFAFLCQLLIFHPREDACHR